MSAELIRGAVDTKDVQFEIDQQRKELAEEASKVLSYNYLAHTLSSSRVKEVGKQANAEKAAVAFATIGIQPYTQESVDAYKTQKLRQLRTKHLLRNFSVSEKGEGTMVKGEIAAVLGALSYGVECIYAYPTPVHPFPKIAGHVSVGCMVVGLILWWGLALARHIYGRTSIHFDWHINSLKDFDSFVPDFALSHAVALAKELPSASFYVDWVSKNERYYPLPVERDPFLVMDVGLNRYYVDVWDEKDFESLDSGRKS